MLELEVIGLILPNYNGEGVDYPICRRLKQFFSQQ